MASSWSTKSGREALHAPDLGNPATLHQAATQSRSSADRRRAVPLPGCQIWTGPAPAAATDSTATSKPSTPGVTPSATADRARLRAATPSASVPPPLDTGRPRRPPPSEGREMPRRRRRKPGFARRRPPAAARGRKGGDGALRWSRVSSPCCSREQRGRPRCEELILDGRGRVRTN